MSWVSVVAFAKALDALEEALGEPMSSIVRDATIQRFEFCVELSWKTARRVMGTSSSAPRNVFREMAAEGLVTDLDLWFGFLDARNLSSHVYNEAIAEKVFASAKAFLPVGRDLQLKLEAI